MCGWRELAPHYIVKALKHLYFDNWERVVAFHVLLGE